MSVCAYDTSFKIWNDESRQLIIVSSDIADVYQRAVSHKNVRKRTNTFLNTHWIQKMDNKVSRTNFSFLLFSFFFLECIPTFKEEKTRESEIPWNRGFHKSGKSGEISLGEKVSGSVTRISPNGCIYPAAVWKLFHSRTKQYNI